MFDKFDGSAVKQILVAEQEARRLGHKHLDTEQVLLGMLMDVHGIPAQVLGKLGLKQQGVRKRIADALGPGAGFVGVETPFTSRTVSLLDAAWKIAKQRNNEQISPEHLLLAFADVYDGLAGEILADAKITPEIIRDEVDKCLGLNERHGG